MLVFVRLFVPVFVLVRLFVLVLVLFVRLANVFEMRKQTQE